MLKPRMLCADCGSVSHPDTLLVGSDLVEMIGWLFFSVPGWLYCWWRHQTRIKVCPDCGSTALVREARAVASLAPQDAPDSSRVANLAGPVRWPAALATPRNRLRRGEIAMGLWTAVLITWGLAVAGLLPGAAIAAAAAFAGVLNAAWLAAEARRMHASLGVFRAWDETRGRALRVEILS